MTLLNLLILSIATWRISYLVSSEAGPFNIFGRLRKKLPLGGLTDCLYCVSLWVGPLSALILLWGELPLTIGFMGIASSGGAIMLNSYTGAGHA